MVDGATSEWIPIVSSVPQVTVMGHFLLILYTSEMFELVENRLYDYADDSTLLAIVRKTADRPSVAATLNMDLARIQEWYNHWCMIQNPNRTKALMVCRSRNLNPANCDLVLSGVSICASPIVDTLGVRFDSKFTFEEHVRGIVSRVCQIIFILRMVKPIFLDTSVLLRCYYYLYSKSLSIVLRCGVCC